MLHAVAEKTIAAPGTAWHCCLEFFSVATRLPPEFRLTPADAVHLIQDEILARMTVHDLPAGDRMPMWRAAAQDGTAGGRIYDAHIAEVARAAGASVVVTDNRRHFLAALRHGIRVETPRSFSPASRASEADPSPIADLRERETNLRSAWRGNPQDQPVRAFLPPTVMVRSRRSVSQLQMRVRGGLHVEGEAARLRSSACRADGNGRGRRAGYRATAGRRQWRHAPEQTVRGAEARCEGTGTPRVSSGLPGARGHLAVYRAAHGDRVRFEPALGRDPRNISSPR